MKDKVPGMEELQKKVGDFVNKLKKEYGDGIQDVKFNTFPQNQKDNEKPGTVPEEKPEFDFNFNLKPKEVKSYLDQYVIKQDEAKKILSIAVCDHYNHVTQCVLQDRLRKKADNNEIPDEEYCKQNVIMIGPTGVGKTYLIKTIAKLIGVPFVKADATKFSETGYVGGNVEDLIRDLVNEADGNVELAKYGMVYIDEIDKISASNNFYGKDVSGRGVQTGLLKLMEETDVDLTAPYDPISQMRAVLDFQKKGKAEKRTINTKHILFFVSGAFNKLDEVIKKRMHKQGIGFGAEIIQNQESEDYLEECKSVDFIEYGFEPEFVGRLPVRVVCYELSVKNLYNILKHSEGSIVKQYQNAFKAYGIDVIFSDESLWRIAEKAYEEKTGARALSTVCERTMREFKFELPSSEIKHFVVTSEMVNDPKTELKKLMENPKANKIIIAHELLKEYEKQFMTKHQIKLSFSDEAAGLISQKSEETQKDIKDVCDEILSDYEYGLNLIKRNTGKTEFTITREVILDPSGTLDKWFKEYYNKQ